MTKDNSILATIKSFIEYIDDYSSKASLYCHYASDVLHNRFPAGEADIAQDPYFAYCYAYYVIKDKFPASEPAIAKTAIYSFLYATEIIKNRFPAGEKKIFNSIYKDSYEINILQKLGLSWRNLGYE